MSIVMLVGVSREADYEHRHVVARFLEAFPKAVRGIIKTDIPPKPLKERIASRWRQRRFVEWAKRLIYNATHPVDRERLGHLLEPDGPVDDMPGGDLRHYVSNHNSEECARLIKTLKPDVIAVYGTRLIHEHINNLAGKATLNLHTGLSPYYRGDSTLFWPVFYEEFDRIGVTVHRLEPAVDAGDIVSTGTISLEPGDDEIDLFAEGVRLGAKLYVDAVSDLLNNRIVYHRQDLSLGREFRYRQCTVAAEKRVDAILARMNEAQR